MTTGFAAVDALTLSDRLPDGTECGAVVPPDWNGTLLLDLDFLTAWQSPTYQMLFAQGYAGAGTVRNYTDPSGGQHLRPWVERVLAVADRIAAFSGKPERVVAWGVSRGGHVALAAAQLHPERIDGAIPRGIYGGAATLMNQDLDLMSALKALLAPKDDRLPVVNLSSRPATPMPTGLEPGLSAWNKVVADALENPQGRARLALAAALAQLPDWADGSVPRPAPDDEEAIADGWIQNIISRIGPIGTFSFMRPAFETSAGGNFSWNAGVDYYGLLTGRRRELVERLHRAAGLDLGDDLETIGSAARISPEPGAAWFLRDASVNFGGGLRVPTLTTTTIGDPLLPVSGLDALRQAVRRDGGEDMLRMTFIEAAGHCAFSPGEDLALVAAMTRRLDAGGWGNFTSPDEMNARAAQLDTSGGRFACHDLEPFGRAHLLGDPTPDCQPAQIDGAAR